MSRLGGRRPGRAVARPRRASPGPGGRRRRRAGRAAGRACRWRPARPRPDPTARPARRPRRRPSAASASWRKNSACPPSSASSRPACTAVGGELRVRRRQQQRGRLGPGERDPAVAAGDGAGAGPDHLAGRAELVEVGRRVVGHPAGQHQPLPGRGRHGDALQLLDRGGDRLDAARRRARPAASGAGTRPGRPAAPARSRGAARPASGGAAAAAPRRRTTRSRPRRRPASSTGVNSPAVTRPVAASRLSACSTTNDAEPEPGRAAGRR